MGKLVALRTADLESGQELKKAIATARGAPDK